MRKLLLPVLIAAPLMFAGCSPSAEKLNNTGNEAFASQDYDQALAAYQQAETESPELAEPHFNAANAHYRQENFDGARQEIEQALVKDKGDLTQDSFYNLGNSFYQAKDYEQAIEAYKETLRLNPEDAEAKHNLELALQQMQPDQQQQDQQDQQQDQQDQQQQDQQDPSQDQQQQDQQDQQQDQSGESKDQQNQSDQPQDKPSGDQQSPDQQDNGSGDQPQAQQDGQPGDQQQDNPQQNPAGDQPQDQQNEQQPGDQPDQQPGQDQQDQPPQNGQAGGQVGEPTEGQPDGQAAQVVEGLSPEQAKQLFEAATRGTESLEEYLQQVLVAPGGQPAEDW